MYNHVLWTNVAGANGCVLETVDNLEDPLELTRGVTIAPWPKDVVFRMDPNFPKAKKLTDSIKNLPGAIVASKALKELIEGRNPNNLQYLPVSIIDHKGRLASKDYFVVNPTKLQDCIDLDRSQIDWNALDPERISACNKMVIDESKIEQTALLFRLKYYATKVLVHRDLANLIKDTGSSGVKFVEIEDMEY